MCVKLFSKVLEILQILVIFRCLAMIFRGEGPIELVDEGNGTVTPIQMYALSDPERVKYG